ncbi:MAG: TolC family protein, partial [Candidatus Saccharimonadales bacterium]
MKNLLIIFFIAGNIITGGKTACAQDTLLHHYMQTAVANNPGLMAKFKAYYAALEKIPQVGALPDPNAVLGYYVLPVETKVGPGVANFQLSQSFPWFGTLAAKKDEASKWAAAEYQVFQSAKNDLFFQLKLKYYQLYFVNQSIRSRQSYLEILQRDEKVTLAKVSGGQTSLADV